MGRGLHVAVVGATGAVGQQMLKTLEDRNFEMDTLTLLSSKRSAGTKVTFKGQELTVQEASLRALKGKYCFVQRRRKRITSIGTRSCKTRRYCYR